MFSSFRDICAVPRIAGEDNTRFKTIDKGQKGLLRTLCNSGVLFPSVGVAGGHVRVTLK